MGSPAGLLYCQANHGRNSYESRYRLGSQACRVMRFAVSERKTPVGRDAGRTEPAPVVRSAAKLARSTWPRIRRPEKTSADGRTPGAPVGSTFWDLSVIVGRLFAARRRSTADCERRRLRRGCREEGWGAEEKCVPIARWEGRVAWVAGGGSVRCLSWGESR